MNIVVTGGLGYIGAHVTHALIDAGHTVTIVDDLSKGKRDRAPASARVILASIDRLPVMVNVLRDADAVIHLAARKSPAESMREPDRYWRNNVIGLSLMLDAVKLTGVRKVIFASSANVYASHPAPVTEGARVGPLSPYGRTKLAAEWMLQDTPGIAPIIFRFFNVAGTIHPQWIDTDSEVLIPTAIRAVLRDEPPVIYGDDYDTPDGTCVRDFIHPQDIATACIAALSAETPAGIYNLGSGRGTTVREVLAAIRGKSGGNVTPTIGDRRAGDIVFSVADPTLFHEITGWQTRYTVGDIVASEWRAALTAQ